MNQSSLTEESFSRATSPCRFFPMVGQGLPQPAQKLLRTDTEGQLVQPAAKSTVVAALHAAIPRHRLLLPNAPATMGVTRSREHLCPRFYCHSSTPAFCCWMLLPTSTTGSEGESAGETQSALADWRCLHSGPTRAQGGLTQQGSPSAEITLKQTRRYRLGH